MKLHQINIEYQPEQDRLLMRVSTGNNEEVLLWFTRRCVKLLWPVLVNLAKTVPEIVTQSHPEAKDAMLGMQHEAALAKSDFSKSYDATGRSHPLGDVPILVARIQTKRNPNGSSVLTLLPGKGQGINLALDEALLHSVCKLLLNILDRTDWNLKLEWPQIAGASAEQPRVLN